MINNIKCFLKLIKPGILFGNFISLIGGFFLASKGEYDLKFLFNLSLGTIFVMASSCILNNIIDSDIDSKMDRTKDRFLCKNKDFFSIFYSIIFSILTYFIGFFIFFKKTNFLCQVFLLLSFFIYVILYTIIFKRTSIYSIIIGGFSGGIPPLIGYVSVSNKIDICCIILLFMFIVWQISHFYSILIYRFEDYKKANLPIYLRLSNFDNVKRIIQNSIFLFFIFNFLLFFFKFVNYIFFLILSVLCFFWLLFSIYGTIFLTKKKWSRSMFFISIFVIFMESILMSIFYL